MLIPPSVLMIVWAILTESSVGALFLAGVLPGILLGSAFIAYCVIAAKRNPKLAPTADVQHDIDRPAGEARSELISGLGIVALIFIVLGGIWLGVFTPTEAAGFGALGSLVVGWSKGMRLRGFMDAIYNAGRSTAPIMFLLIAGSMYSRLLAVSGGINMIQELFFGIGLGPVGIIVIMTLIWLALGTLIDSISDILLTIPIFVPIALAAGLDPMAFAIYGILIIEAGLLTPPMGLLIFTVKATVPDPDVSLQEIFKGAIPYWIIMIGVAVSILVFPWLASWLPATVLQ
jgi:tripartite ATP-independent transporter DctM subunit